MQKRPPFIIIAGPTAVGKTDLSIKLAQAIGGEIISADSMQVYRYMDIGSAKISSTQMCGIKHHLIDVLDPDETFNVVIFQQMAQKAVEDILSRGKIPILVGGTGFYIQALLYGIDFCKEENTNPEIRNKYENMSITLGAHALHEKLRLVDPEAADAIPENNVKRVIRALEFYDIHQTRISEHNRNERKKESCFQECFFVLTDDRKILYERINQRVDVMFDRGLIEEVRDLQTKGITSSMTAMQGIGYKEILSFLQGDCSIEDAKEQIKQSTRHFAKRQITWFKREENVIWVNKHDFNHDEEAIFTYVLDYVKTKYKI